jgi:hypothetical protein
MARYLIVAHQTAASRALIERAQTLLEEDRSATFTLLIPATHATDILQTEPGARFTWEEHAVWQRAHAKADEPRSEFEQAGLHLQAALIGDASPVLAVEDELRMHPAAYDAILLSTLPRARSRWLEEDVDTRLRKLGLPVIHVAGEPNPIWRPGMALKRALSRIPVPGMLRSVGRPLHPHGMSGMMVILALMALYLAGSAALAVTIDRTFFMNDVVAIAVFGALMGGLCCRGALRHPALRAGLRMSGRSSELARAFAAARAPDRAVLAAFDRFAQLRELERAQLAVGAAGGADGVRVAARLEARKHAIPHTHAIERTDAARPRDHRDRLWPRQVRAQRLE